MEALHPENRFWEILTFLFVLFLSVGNLFAQQPTINWIPTLGGNSTHVYGISASGQVVVGTSNDSSYEERAFRWTITEGIQNLGTLGGNQSSANSANSDGSVIVGWSRDASDIKRAFIWTQQYGLQDLGAGDWTDAVDVSDDGSVVLINNGWDGFAYRWTGSGGLENLGTLGGSQTFAYDMSADGSVIVGFSYDSLGAPYAFRWVSGIGIQKIGTYYSFAYGVSADGNTVTGSETGAAGLHRAFRWTQVGGFEFNIAGNFSYGLALSGDGSIIVGDGGDGAFRLTGSAGLEYLHQVYSGLLPQNSELTDAVDITPDGLFIVGNGVNPTNGLEGYIIAVNGVSSVNELNANPEGFALLQNYPNPFNPNTIIKYSIPSVGTRLALSVQLKVYDVLGNEIATLVNEEKQAGVYEIQFNVAQDSRPAISSGIYFYKLTAGDFVQTRKMMLIK
jgi:probable HAF family extracellular repeat protein